MSTPFDPTILTRRTTENMEDKEYFLVVSDGDDDLAVAGDLGICIGAMTNDVADGSSTAIYVPVQIGGVIKVKVGAACTSGNLCSSDGNGEAKDYTPDTGGGTDAFAFGIALGTYADGDVGAFLWSPTYYISA